MIAILALLLGLGSLADPGLTPQAARAQDPPADFTFKRVRAPSPGTRKRITVQIGTTATARPPRPAQRSTRYDFFWAEVPPGGDIPAASRIALALAALSKAREAGVAIFEAPATLDRIVLAIGAEIEAAALRHDVSEAFLLAIILVESAGNAKARSPKDAQGLMQLIPATARRFGVTDVWDPAQNIAGGAEYLALLLEMFDGDPLLALAGYNAGENAVLRAGGVPNYSETRAYVPKVLATWLVARELCFVPPETPRQRCHFIALGQSLPPPIRIGPA